MTQATPAQALAHLSRLASKPGVRATLILSRADGAIVQSTGFNGSQPEDIAASRGSSIEPEDANADTSRANGSLEGIARTVFDLVNAAGALAGGLMAAEEGGNAGRGERLLDSTGDEERRDLDGVGHAVDDVQLLRVRTRKGEAVVVPDSKYLLVVIHDGPKAP